MNHSKSVNEFTILLVYGILSQTTYTNEKYLVKLYTVKAFMLIWKTELCKKNNYLIWLDFGGLVPFENLSLTASGKDKISFFVLGTEFVLFV